MRRSSSAVGAGVSARSAAIATSQPIVSRTRLDRRARVERVEAHLAGVVEVVDAEVRDDDATARARASRPRAGCARPARRRRGCPGDVRKSIFSTNERRDWRMITNTWRALIAISHAPPGPGQPGRRVVVRRR